MQFTKQVLIGIALLSMGCADKRPQFSINGIVVDKENIIGPYMLSTTCIDEDSAIVEGVVITLSFDEAGQDQLVAPTTTNQHGEYSLVIPKLLPPKNDYGYYYLTAKRSGDIKFVKQIRIGPIMDYGQNTIVLMRPKPEFGAK